MSIISVLLNNFLDLVWLSSIDPLIFHFGSCVRESKCQVQGERDRERGTEDKREGEERECEVHAQLSKCREITLWRKTENRDAVFILDWWCSDCRMANIDISKYHHKSPSSQEAAEDWISGALLLTNIPYNRGQKHLHFSRSSTTNLRGKKKSSALHLNKVPFLFNP